MVGYALTRDRWPAPLRRVTGALTLIFGYLSAVPGLNSTFEAPIIYALKVTISTFGMGMLFGQFLPDTLGVSTFHNVVRRPDVGLAHLLHGPTTTLVQLIATQLAMLVIFLGAVALVSFALTR